MIGLRNQISALSRIYHTGRAGIRSRMIAGSPVEPGVHRAEFSGSKLLILCLLPFCLHAADPGGWTKAKWGRSEQQLSPDVARPDHWRGLVLGESTPEDTMSVFGEPQADKVDRLFIRRIDKWFVPGLRRKTLRKQTYKSMQGFDRVDLYYFEGRLAVIQLDFAKKIDPNALSNIYGLQFAPFSDPHNPVDYSLVATSDKAVICATVSKVGPGSGKVRLLQLISRQLENRQGLDLLK